MDSGKELKKSKGGRPKKTSPRNHQLGVLCTYLERQAIEFKAKQAGLAVSVYLRQLAIKGQVVIAQKTLPKDVLLVTGNLNHIAANLNQLARKKNSGEDLNDAEKKLLLSLCEEVKLVALLLKNKLQ